MPDFPHLSLIYPCLALTVCTGLPLSAAVADGSAIGKVYTPYVQPLERELEFQWLSAKDGSEHTQDYKLGVGRSLSDIWFAEVYLLGKQEDEKNLEVEGYELEIKHQLTEQGEYSADWGLLLELEKERAEDIYEASLGLLTVKEWGRYSITSNAFVVYEGGEEIDDEWETSLRLQAKYRLSESMEPALEYFAGEDTQALGPSLLGILRLQPGTKLRWQSGLLFGLESVTPDYSFKLQLEYEF